MASNPNIPNHPKFDERISVQVEGQLPDFVKQDHATFIAFLKAYYEYLEQIGKPYEIIGNLRNYFNIDKTVDDFLNYFKNQFGKDVPEAVFANANKPAVLKRLRDFYRAKGSESAFQFLFRLLYKEEIEFYYPSIDMLRVSDGRYTKDKIIRCIDTSGTGAIYNLNGKSITGSSSSASAIVELVLKEQIGAFEVSTIYLSKTIGTFVAGETITDGVNDYTIEGMITGVAVTNAGSGYTIGTLSTVSGGGLAAVGGSIKIAELTTGSITQAVIDTVGSGYAKGDKLTIDNTDKLEIDGRTCSILVKNINGTGGITAVDIEHNGYGYTGVPTVSGGSGNGAVITLSGTNIGGIQKLKIASNGFLYTEAPIVDLTGSGDGLGTATVYIGGYEGEASERWVGDDGQISSANYIQDSYYYQSFSYEIKASNTVDKWRDYVKRLVHPAGMALFGKTTLSTLVATNLRLTTPVYGPHLYPYTIIFHETAPWTSPSIRLNMSMQQDLDEWPSTGVWPHTGYQSGHGGHSDWHIYRKELPIIILPAGDKDDWGSIVGVVAAGPVFNQEWGDLPSEAFNNEDWAYIYQPSEGTLKLGPLIRTIEQQKFKKEGGFSKSNYLRGGSGYVLGTTTVTIDPPPSGTTATAEPIVGSYQNSDGTVTDGITGFTITNAGSGYIATPNVTITDTGTGSGAVAKVATDGNIAYAADFFYSGSPASNAVPGEIKNIYLLHETHDSTDRTRIPPPEGTKNVDPATWEDIGGGYPASFFENVLVSSFIDNQEEKTIIAMNSDITHLAIV